VGLQRGKAASRIRGVLLTPLKPVLVLVNRVGLRGEELLQPALVAFFGVGCELLLLLVEAVMIDDSIAILLPLAERCFAVQPMQPVGVPDEAFIDGRERAFRVAEKSGREWLGILQLGDAFGQKMNADTDSQEHDRGGGQSSDTIR